MSLLINESIKLYSKKSTILVILITFLMGFFTAPFEKHLLDLNDGAQYVSYLGNTYSFINLFVVIIASTIITSEFSQGTITFLLIRPYSRYAIFLSKIVTMNLFLILISCVLLIASIFAAYVFFEQHQLFISTNQFQGYSAVGLSTKTLIANALLCLLYISICVFISTILRTQAFTVGICVALLFSSSLLNLMSSYLIDKVSSYFKWNVFNMLNVRNLIIKSEFSVNTELNTNEAILGVILYSVLFFIISYLVFSKREIFKMES